MNGTTTIDEAIKEAESELEALGLRIQKLKLIRRHYPDAVAFRLPNDEWAFASEAAAAKATGVDLRVLQMNGGKGSATFCEFVGGGSDAVCLHRYAIYAEVPSEGLGYTVRVYSPLQVDAAKAFDDYNAGEYRELVEALQATTKAILDRKAKLAEAHPDVRPS